MTPVPDWLLLLLAAPFVGSLGGVLFRRLPEGRPVGWARSECERCGTGLGPVELLPILGFALLRGRCRHCRAPIAPYHLLAELLAPAVVLVVSAVLGPGAPLPDLLGGCCLGWAAVLLAAIDARCWLLPDVLTLPLLLAGLFWCGWTGGAAGLHAAAAAGAYLLFRAIELGYRRLRGRDGLGQGDAKLFAAAGAWLGPFALPETLLAAALLTLLPALLLSMLRGRRPSGAAAVPFGPGLALAAWGCWLWVMASGAAGGSAAGSG